MELETTIHGIPCIIGDIRIVAAEPATREYPGEYEQIDWQVCDRKGYPAPWLERKMDDYDRGRITEF